MIPLSLLKATESRAPGFAVYGGPGLKKTHAVCTLPPPILLLDVGEGGTASVLPWIRRRRNYNQTSWTEYTDSDRQGFLDMLDEDTSKARALKSPGPYIDVIHYDNTEVDAYDAFVKDVANFDLAKYNSLAEDSLQEFSFMTQVKARGAGNYDSLMTTVAFSWSGAQERAVARLKKIRNYRDAGVFIYLVGSEDIAKDYVRNPLEKRAPGEPTPEAYSVRGTVDLPGKLASGLVHIPDILMHAKMETGQITWITEPEPLPGGGAHWDGKDRFGRLPKRVKPNFRDICKKLYGDEGMAAIYTKALGDLSD